MKIRRSRLKMPASGPMDDRRPGAGVGGSSRTMSRRLRRCRVRFVDQVRAPNTPWVGLVSRPATQWARVIGRAGARRRLAVPPVHAAATMAAASSGRGRTIRRPGVTACIQEQRRDRRLVEVELRVEVTERPPHGPWASRASHPSVDDPEPPRNRSSMNFRYASNDSVRWSM